METPNPRSSPQPGPEQVDPQHRPPPPDPARWAPWWLYVVVLLGANYLRAGLLPVGTVPEAVVVVIALAQAAVLFVLVTAAWRHFHRSGS